MGKILFSPRTLRLRLKNSNFAVLKPMKKVKSHLTTHEEGGMWLITFYRILGDATAAGNPEAPQKRYEKT